MSLSGTLLDLRERVVTGARGLEAGCPQPPVKALAILLRHPRCPQDEQSGAPFGVSRKAWKAPLIVPAPTIW